jgi:anthranilate synthase component 2
MILVIDNYDSFTWNLVDYLRQLGANVRVARNDALGVAEAMTSGAAGFLISPGPGTPDTAGISLDLVGACAKQRRPLLGICLGHQAIAQHFGGRIERAAMPVHGKTASVAHDGSGVFAGLPTPFTAARYHSLAVAPGSVPDALVINATATDATVQGLRHRDLPIHGVQFHPESVASEHGLQLIANFVAMTRAAPSASGA